LNFVGCVSVIVIAHLLQSGHKKDQNSEDH
jgi:hypothetical protein